jgi:hypothetical protein
MKQKLSIHTSGLALLLCLGLAACAGQARLAQVESLSQAQAQQTNHQAMAAPAADRAAILAMAGVFRVRFHFEETVALEPGYAPHEPKISGATELVEVIEDRADFISLQHILVLEDPESGAPRVVKHWRQDWQYQPSQVLRYLGDQHWQPQPISAAQAQGAWSQTVFEVDDAPRYGALGRWRHADGETVWESDYAWRPLPRREYTTREDYQVMGAINRHLITPTGWAHEQINTKLVLDEKGQARPRVREIGRNTYERVEDFDFSAGREYWRKTADYWAQVRRLYNTALARPQGLHLAGDLDGTPRYAASFELAKRVAAGKPAAPVRSSVP